MKDTYNFEAKTKAREEIKKMILATYPGVSRRKSLKVLTLMGHEDNELKEIWDPLQISRQNILNIERDVKPYKLALERFPEITTLHKNLQDYVENADRTFDIINYDSVSPFSLEQRNILRIIAGNQLLGDGGIVATWFMAKRESEYARKWFEVRYDESGNKNYEAQGKIKDRSDLISRMICSIFIDGITNLFLHPLAEHPNFRERFNYIYKELVEESKVKYNISGDEIKFYPQESYCALKKVLSEFVHKVLPTFYSEGSIEDILYYSGIGSYFSKSQNRLKYISNNGTPMFIDINHFQHHDLSSLFKVDLDNDRNNIRLINPVIRKIKDRRKLIDLARHFERWRKRCNGNILTTRYFLGSSYTQKPKLNKEEAIELIKNGFSIEDILGKYPNSFTKMQLAAFKAHCTMGTYK